MKRLTWKTVLGKIALSAVLLYACFAFEQHLSKEFVSSGSAKSGLARSILYWVSNNVVSYYIVKAGLLALGIRPLYQLIREVSANSKNKKNDG